MSPIYQIRSRIIEDLADLANEEITEAIELNGKHVITGEKFSFPITIEGEKVRFHISEAKGWIDRFHLAGQEQEWDFFKYLGIEEILVAPPLNREIAYGEFNNDEEISIKRLEEQPAIGSNKETL